MKRILLSLLLLFPSIAWAGTGSYIEAKHETMATIAFGSVAAAYTVFLANATPNRWYEVDVYNGTDAPITCSYNSGSPAAAGTAVDHFIVPPYSSYDPFLGKAERVVIYPIWCKRTSAAPTVGAVYLSASY